MNKLSIVDPLLEVYVKGSVAVCLHKVSGCFVAFRVVEFDKNSGTNLCSHTPAMFQSHILSALNIELYEVWFRITHFKY